ncbi:Fis family transcriptional regulator [Caminibacter mediatlanticus TB-2]|uniref:Fis family transcriptional regulator n=1 Tax=Caminibacter mediatlanticus TB-2 TaxID=391592 RepID=A0ABX5V9X4_9BACT|nr:Fis family transcriptional regulator [Caminibacter mediatlanticus]QCT94177.1 Fis family transcriptional regulator [Caminibacter mediatlanticus TB-2]
MFIAKSEYMQKIKNIADKIKTLKLNVYIWGDVGVGKTFLAKYIAPDGIINPNKDILKPVIIEDFDKKLQIVNGEFIIATGSKLLNKDIIDRYFTIDIELKPLKERKEEINDFISLFTKEASEILKINKKIKIKNPDISENLNSLKRQVYKKMLLSSKNEIFDALKEILKEEHLTYDEEIKTFEKVLFSAMKEIYKSKLKISEKLKMNRVTLTKKMKELNV